MNGEEDARISSAMMNKIDVPSPCIDVCKMDPESDLCEGCLRTRAEIKAWRTLDTEAKRALLAELEKRRALLPA